MSNWLERYNAVYEKYVKETFPNWHKDGHHMNPKKPDVTTEKGFKDFIVNFIRWDGGAAYDMRKISGVMANEAEKGESGVVLIVKKFKRTGVQKGIADVDSTIDGRTYKWEIKIRSDRPSATQLKIQAEIVRAKGYYYFTKEPDDFLYKYDAIKAGMPLPCV